MARKAKNWKEILKDPIILRILEIIDKYENGSVPKFISKTGIDKGTYYICLERDSAPKVDTLVKIKYAYNISLDWLICGDGEISECVKSSPDESTTKNAKLEGRIEELEKKVQEYKDQNSKLLDKLSSNAPNKKFLIKR